MSWVRIKSYNSIGQPVNPIVTSDPTLPSHAIDFVWHLENKSLDYAEQYSESKRMLKELDRLIHISNGDTTAKSHETLAHLYEVRLYLLTHIYTLTTTIEWEQDSADIIQ